MARAFRGRRSERERILKFNAADRFYAAAAGVEPRFQQEVPKARAKRTRSSDEKRPLERQVLKAVIAALRYDPRVARVERNQSGLFQDGARFIRVGSPGKLDLTVYLKDGRYIEIEVKRPGGKPSEKQAARIESIRRAGGLSGYCYSAESAIALLP